METKAQPAIDVWSVADLRKLQADLQRWLNVEAREWKRTELKERIATIDESIKRRGMRM